MRKLQISLPFFSPQALKRDDELNALAKKAEQESSGQPENKDESEMSEPIRTSNELVHPLRYAHTNLKLSM